MWPTFCGLLGVAGWLVMLVLWAGVIATVVWGIARLFPDRTGPVVPPQPDGMGEDAPSSLVDSGQR